jgi:hypothetical protein
MKLLIIFSFPFHNDRIYEISRLEIKSHESISTKPMPTSDARRVTLVTKASDKS